MSHKREDSVTRLRDEAGEMLDSMPSLEETYSVSERRSITFIASLNGSLTGPRDFIYYDPVRDTNMPALATNSLRLCSGSDDLPPGTDTLTYPGYHQQIASVGGLHASVIQDRSPLLAAAFESSSSGQRLHLETLCSQTVMPFLRFLYTGSYAQSGDWSDVPTSVLLHCKMYWLGDLYDLPDLKSQAYVNVLRQFEFGCSSPYKPIALCEAIDFTYKTFSGHDTILDVIVQYCVTCCLSHRLHEDTEFRNLAFNVRAFHQDLTKACRDRGYEDESSAAIIRLPYKHFTPDTYASTENPPIAGFQDIIHHFHSSDRFDDDSSPRARRRVALNEKRASPVEIPRIPGFSKPLASPASYTSPVDTTPGTFNAALPIRQRVLDSQTSMFTSHEQEDLSSSDLTLPIRPRDEVERLGTAPPGPGFFGQQKFHTEYAARIARQFDPLKNRALDAQEKGCPSDGENILAERQERRRLYTDRIKQVLKTQLGPDALAQPGPAVRETAEYYNDAQDQKPSRDTISRQIYQNHKQEGESCFEETTKPLQSPETIKRRHEYVELDAESANYKFERPAFLKLQNREDAFGVSLVPRGLHYVEPSQAAAYDKPKASDDTCNGSGLSVAEVIKFGKEVKRRKVEEGRRGAFSFTSPRTQFHHQTATATPSQTGKGHIIAQGRFGNAIPSHDADVSSDFKHSNVSPMLPSTVLENTLSDLVSSRSNIEPESIASADSTLTLTTLLAGEANGFPPFDAFDPPENPATCFQQQNASQPVNKDSPALQDYRMQLKLLEQQSKTSHCTAWAEPFSLEANLKSLDAACGSAPSDPFDPPKRPSEDDEQQSANQSVNNGSRALQDYQMQLEQLEQQNKKQFLMEWTEDGQLQCRNLAQGPAPSKSDDDENVSATACDPGRRSTIRSTAVEDRSNVTEAPLDSDGDMCETDSDSDMSWVDVNLEPADSQGEPAAAAKPTSRLSSSDEPYGSDESPAAIGRRSSPLSSDSEWELC